MSTMNPQELPERPFDDDDRPAFSEERGIPNVGRKKGPSRIWFIVGAGVLAVVIAAVAVTLALNKLKGRGAGASEVQADTVQSQRASLGEDAFNPAAPPLPEGTAPAPCAIGQVSTPEAPCTPPPPPCAVGQASTPEAPCAPPAQPGAPQQPGQPAQLTPEQQAARDLAERRQRAPVLPIARGMDGQGASGSEAAEGGTPAASNNRGSLGRALQASVMGGVSATQLDDPNMTITAGRLLPCTLETAINSQLPGMTSCVLTRDVYSTNGRVLLLERGSRVIGQYESGQTRRGVNRIFVLWTRAETPNGVLIALDSPSTDPLGRSGVTGKVKKHFFERFGSALLLSLVDDVAAFAVERQREDNQNGGGIVFSSTTNSSQDAAAIIVENSINIPPTIDLHQGASVGIFVARDLYFGDVYSLRPTYGSRN